MTHQFFTEGTTDGDAMRNCFDGSKKEAAFHLKMFILIRIDQNSVHYDCIYNTTPTEKMAPAHIEC